MSFLPNSLSNPRILSTTESASEGHESHGNTHEGSQEGHSHGHETELFIFFVMICLFAAGVLREIYKKTKIPFTPMIVVAGMLLEAYRQVLGPETRSVELLANINPHVLLFIFIPVLIFESALNMDYYIFRKSLVNCLLLAGPGVLITAVLIAFTLKEILGYTDEEGISWNAAMTIGCIAGATDPVAVVALLKELGAPIRFNILIEGESLLNDGSAMVFFDLFLVMVKGEQKSLGQVFVGFVRLAICGPILGVLIGIVASMWLRRVIRDDILTTLITFMACYTSFFLSQYTPLQVSGILSVVALGCFMSAVGKTKIYHESEHALHSVWAFVQWCCESLLFLITGILIGRQFLSDDLIVFSDWINVVLLWAIMIVIRMIMVYLFYPLYQYGGYELNWREVFVMGYGGLRGALGLCLALMVGVDQTLNPRFRALTVFSLSGVATLTLVVNGLTAQFFVEKLGIIPFPDIKIRILKNTLKSIMNECKEKEKELKVDKYLSMAKWKSVEQFYSLNKTLEELSALEAKQLMEKKVLTKNLLNEESHLSKRISLAGKEYEGHSETEILIEIRFITLTTMKGLVWEKFQTNEIEADSSYVMDDSLNMALDIPDKRIEIWKNVIGNLTSNSSVNYLMRFQDTTLIGPLIRSSVTRTYGILYEISTVYLHIIEEALEVMDQIPVKSSSVKEIKEELHDETKLTEEFIMHLTSAHPEIMTDIQTNRACMLMSHQLLNSLQTHFDTGYIQYQDYNGLRNYFDAQTSELENKVPDWNIDNFDKSVLHYPVFASLNQGEIEKVVSKGKKLTFPQGTIITTKNQPLVGIYLVLNGIVQDSITSESQKLCPPGSILGISSIVSRTNLSLTKSKAKTEVTLLSVPLQDFVELLNTHPKLMKNIVVLSCYYFIKLKPETAAFLGDMDEKSMILYLIDTTLERVPKDSVVEYNFGGFVLFGELVDIGNYQNQVTQFSVIEEFTSKYSAVVDCEVIRFNRRCPEQTFVQENVQQKRVSFFM